MRNGLKVRLYALEEGIVAKVIVPFFIPEEFNPLRKKRFGNVDPSSARCTKLLCYLIVETLIIESLAPIRLFLSSV